MLGEQPAARDGMVLEYPVSRAEVPPDIGVGESGKMDGFVPGGGDE